MSVKAVDVCPMSEKEWQQASMRMKCGELASKQTCSPVEKFKYHCVINPFRNQTLEVCAPEILISGNRFTRCFFFLQNMSCSRSVLL